VSSQWAFGLTGTADLAVAAKFTHGKFPLYGDGEGTEALAVVPVEADCWLPAGSFAPQHPHSRFVSRPGLPRPLVATRPARHDPTNPQQPNQNHGEGKKADAGTRTPDPFITKGTGPPGAVFP